MITINKQLGPVGPPPRDSNFYDAFSYTFSKGTLNAGTILRIISFLTVKGANGNYASQILVAGQVVATVSGTLGPPDNGTNIAFYKMYLTVVDNQTIIVEFEAIARIGSSALGTVQLTVPALSGNDTLIEVQYKNDSQATSTGNFLLIDRE